MNRPDILSPGEPEIDAITAQCFVRFEEAFGTRGFAWDVQAQIMSLGKAIEIGKGESATIFADEDSLIFLAEGACKLVAWAAFDRAQVLSFHFAGDLVSVPARAEHEYGLIALTPSRILSFPTRRFLQAVNEESKLLVELHRRTDAALAECRDDSVGLGRKTAQERVARLLMQMAGRIGIASDNGVLIELPMSRGDIADSLGLTIETVSRQFGELRDAGLIETGGRSGVRVLDPEALLQRAGPTCPRA